MAIANNSLAFYCICCSGNSYKELSYKDEFFNNNLIFCNTCGHVSLKFIPDENQIYDYYNDKYSKDRMLYSNDPGYVGIMNKRAEAQYDYITKFVEIKNKKVYDLGCGYGYFVEFLSNKGIYATGFDYDKNAVSHCQQRGINVKYISNNDSLNIESDSIIVLSHTLEHLLNFDEYLTVIKAKCEYIFIEIPQYDYRIKDMFIDMEGHINFFSLNSLRCYFNKKGLNIVDLSCHGPNLKLFWKNCFPYSQLKKILLKSTNDYYLNGYNKISSKGIWIRAIIKT